MGRKKAFCFVVWGGGWESSAGYRDATRRQKAQRADAKSPKVKRVSSATTNKQHATLQASVKPLYSLVTAFEVRLTSKREDIGYSPRRERPRGSERERDGPHPDPKVYITSAGASL